jgi:RNA polymerase sigma-70 factor (ECF subfamily)
MTSGNDDFQLIERFKKGDMSAFTEIVKRYQKPLINYFYIMSKDRDFAEDCAQEVFLRLYGSLKRYVRKAKFTTFLFKIAKNLWIDVVRSKELKTKPISLDATYKNNQQPLLNKIKSQQETPMSLTSQEERRQKIRETVLKLPDHLKEVVILSEFEGMKYEEISYVLGIPVGTVKSRMHSAILHLKKILKEIL